MSRKCEPKKIWKFFGRLFVGSHGAWQINQIPFISFSNRWNQRARISTLIRALVKSNLFALSQKFDLAKIVFFGNKAFIFFAEFELHLSDLHVQRTTWTFLGDCGCLARGSIGCSLLYRVLQCFFFAFSFSSHEHVNSCELFNVCMLLDVITNGSFAECFTVQCHSAEYFLSRCHLCQPWP